MNWVLLSVLSAMLQAVNDLLTKKKLTRISALAVAWAPFPISFVFLLPLVLIQGAPPVEPSFYLILLAVGLLDSAGVVLYITAIKSSELSLVLPIQMCTPIFLIVTSPLMLGEYPGVLGCCGVLLIVVGSYIVNLNNIEQGLLGPFRAIAAQKGPRCMFLAALIWSFAWNLHKAGVVGSSPLFYIICHQFVVGTFLGLFLLFRRRSTFAEVKSNLPFFLLISAVFAVMLTCQMNAVVSGMPVYVAAIKRTSVLIGVVLGVVLFKEMGFRERLTGAGVMVTGVFLTAM